MTLSIFSCAYWPSLCLLWRNVCVGLLPIFFYIEWYKLYILEINYHLHLFANIFSHFVGCLFILIMISFAVQKLLTLTRSHFCACSHYSRRQIQKNIATIYSKECLPCFPLVLYYPVLHLGL